MRGDIAFVGFMLTADEWQELDPQSRAQLIAVATRRVDPDVEPPRRFPEGTGKHEIIDVIDDELDELLELDADDADSNLEPVSSTRPVDDALITAPCVDDGWEDAADHGWEDFSDLNEI
jgi:hypothetical protein